MYDVDITIVGAGVIGLSIAMQVSRYGEVFVLEQEESPGRGISSRNSEVIHAGIYFPPAFLKTRLCVEGRHLLYEFCERYRVPHQRIGKVIVAVCEGEAPSIERLCTRGLENGVEGLRLLEKSELKAIEPHVQGVCALFSQNTGIIDSHQLMKRIEAIASNAGANILCNTTVCALNKQSSGFVCTAKHKDSLYTFSTRIVINAAGLNSDTIARMAGIDPEAAGYRVYPVKGEYFRVHSKKAVLINGLVYPSPEKDLTGLGIHATKDLSGGLKLGPNAFYIDTIDYQVDPVHRKVFFENVHGLLPFLEEDDLESDMAGIRPKLHAPGEPARDFIITHEDRRDLSGLINLIGIESPGLTACLGISETVTTMLKEAGLI